jgi:hypothetical protein
MEQIDTQRVADIVRRFLESNDTKALTNWKPTQLDNLQAALRNTILREYPELAADVRFLITNVGRDEPDTSIQLEVEILRVVGHVNVAV